MTASPTVLIMYSGTPIKRWLFFALYHFILTSSKVLSALLRFYGI